MKTAQQVVSELVANKDTIFENQQIHHKIADGIRHYTRLQTAYENNEMDEAFKKSFGYFYRMSRYAGSEFKAAYFAMMQDIRNGAARSFPEIADALYAIENKHQFSFITKLIHTTDPDFPIYDSLVSKVLQLPNVATIHGKTAKIMCSHEVIIHVKALYEQMLEIPEFLDLLQEFDRRFDAQLSDIKKIDFMVWAYGSTLNV